MHWDLFCRVIDNFGDIGVCWRLAADLAARGQTVRLWIDDPSALAWMAPARRTRRRGAALDRRHAGARTRRRGGRGLRLRPAAGLRRAAWRAATRPPLWINLEYLSAEAYVRRSHGLRSPQLSGPGQGLDKWFFYPGFEAGTGGLIREPGLMDERQRFDGRAWLQRPRPARRGRANACSACSATPARPLGALLQALAAAPTLLLVTPGAATQALQAALARQPARGHAALHRPALADPGRLRPPALGLRPELRARRGFLRARQWAGAPFVWQIYPQHDAAHAAKLDAFLGLMLQGADAGLDAAVRGLWRAWNGLRDGPLALPHAGPGRRRRCTGASGCWRSPTWAPSCSASWPKGAKITGFARRRGSLRPGDQPAAFD